MIQPETPREGLELVVVGTAMFQPDQFEALAAILEPDTIRHPRTKALWDVLADRIPKGVPVDYAALGTDSDLVKAVGGPAVFAQIGAHAVADARWHAEQLRDLVAAQRTGIEIRHALEQLADDPDAARAAIRQAVDRQDTADWDEPTRLEPPPPPVLDVKLLGGIGEMAQAVADSLQVPVDLPAWFGMAAASAAIGGRRTVSPKPDWSEPVTLYCMTVAAPGEKKSPSRSAMVAPLADEELRRKAADRYAVARDQQDRRIAEAVVAAAEQKVIKATNSTTRQKARADLEAVRSELDELGEPKVPTQMLADDTTPEAAAGVLAEQGERLAVISAEGGFLGNIGGRYSNQPNLEIVLKAWSHEPHTVNRKNGPPLFLTRPNLTLALAVQPGMLSGLGDTAEVFESRGFTGRFLFAVPRSLVGQRSYDTDPVPDEVRRRYADGIARMISRIWDDTEVRPMDLDADARAVFKDFWEDWERRHLVPGDLTAVEGWSKKLPGQILRLAAVMALFDAPDCLTVSGETMANAVALVPYLLAHARLVVDLMSAEKQSRLGPARAVLDWLRKRHPDGALTAEDVKRGVHGQSWFEGVDSVKEALDVLERHGWVRWLPVPERTGRGRRPAPRFVVHPRVLEPPR
ncbi:YfjI family protein [Streptomyces sp. MH13]|uniref:YfjI family protein n=1 Tax=Streptomyces sp. MH13 TaxID=3417651 RepID=UPI003CEB75AF